MPQEECDVGTVTPLPTSLQLQYDQLQAPQCTNLTYINTFLHKLLIFINEDGIRNILCHLSEAVSKLHLIHVSTTA